VTHGPIIRPENSAPSCTTPPLSLSHFLAEARARKLRRVVDVGAGRLRATNPLLDAGLDVWTVETELQLARTAELLSSARRRYPRLRTPLSAGQFGSSALNLDGAVCICVLHTVPAIRGRTEILRALRKNLSVGGLLLLDVPHGLTYYHRPDSRAKEFLDGYIMGPGPVHTFFKEYTESELVSTVERRGFEFVRNLGIRRHHAILFAAASGFRTRRG
jgi:hypothetical protein